MSGTQHTDPQQATPAEAALEYNPTIAYRRLNTPFYVFIFGLFLFQNLWAIRLFFSSNVSLNEYIVWGLFTLVLEITSIIVFAIFLYYSWLAIQDGHARTTPGKAVGFSFIPLFNLYWCYVAWVGLAKDINALIRRNNLTVSPVLPAFIGVVIYIGIPVQIFEWHIASQCNNTIQIISSLAVITMNILGIIVIQSLCNAINSLPFNLTSSSKSIDISSAITTLIFGILSLIPLLGIPLGIAAVILGIICITKKKSGKGMAIAGLTIGSIGFLAASMQIVLFLWYLMSTEL